MVIRYEQPAPALGDIGEGQREIELEPLTEPAVIPAREPVPA